MDSIAVKEWIEQEKESSGEVESDVDLDTKRRRRPSISSDDSATEVEHAADPEADTAATEGKVRRNVYLDEDHGTKRTEPEFFIRKKNLENGSSSSTDIHDDLQTISDEDEKQEQNHIRVINEPHIYIDSIRNAERVIVHQHNNAIAKTIEFDVSEVDLGKTLEEQQTHTEPHLYIDSIRNAEHVIVAAVKPETPTHQHNNTIANTIELDVSEVDLEKVLEEQETHTEPHLYVDSIRNAEHVIVAAVKPETPTHQHNNTIANTIELDVSEVDLEKVLEEQETHDLFCPQCNSCITKRVILRKRKRRVRDFRYEERPEKLRATSDEIAETSRDDELDGFRCLACFSFFTQTENGFNIFRFFRKKDRVSLQVPSMQSTVQTSTTSMQSTIQTSTRDGNWLFTIFNQEPSKSKENKAGAVLPVHSQTSPVLAPSETPNYASNESSKIDGTAHLPVDLSFSTGGDILQNDNKSAPTLPVSIPANSGDSYSGSLKIISGDGDIMPVIINKPDVIGIKLPATVFFPHDEIIKPIVKLDPATSQTVSQDPGISIPAAPPTVFIPQGDVQINVNDGILVEARRDNEWEVLKSIVYGGLIESITSLGVVSSAAGAQTSTLNIVALGLANLIGGFFVLLHDLSELKSSASSTSQTDERAGRYWKLLGRKSNFGLHATVAIISYILFGLLPPVIYGFSFRVSDEKEHKIITVALSSLLCIALLAIGKAHVSEPKSYIKTFLYYLGLGFTASGLSYVAGVMIDRFFEQLGLFEHNAPLLSPPPPLSINLFGANSGMISSF